MDEWTGKASARDEFSRRALLQVDFGAVAGAAVGSHGRRQFRFAAKASRHRDAGRTQSGRGHPHAKKLSAVEAMGAYLDHIEAINPKVNAIVERPA